MTELDPQYAKGLIPRDWDKHPVGSMSFAAPFSLPLIPRDEWRDRIESGKGDWLGDLAEFAKIPVLNQGQVGYCHAFSPAAAVMAQRASQGLPYRELSASSIGGPVTGFRNAGAWIGDDLKQIVNHGVATTKTYPMLTTDNHWNAAAKAEAAQNKVTEWWDGEPRNFAQVMTCLLLRIPVCVAYHWWGHAVTLLSPIYENGKFGVEGPNSWGPSWSYGGAKPGYFRFFEGYGQYRATPDEFYAPRQITGA